MENIETVLKNECRLVKEKPLVVGVSGGPDSLCLLSLIHEFDYSVIAVHVNHHLRKEADDEALKVEEFCKQKKILFKIFNVDVTQFCKEKRCSIEEGARILRYQCLMSACVEANAQALAVAHQADDQIETALMHLLRGSGMSGIKAMNYYSFNETFSKEIPIVRPLLGVWRSEIIEYCAANQITPCYDQTNEDQTYYRNRIRHELVPLLKTYNNQAGQHLWNLSRILVEEDRFLETLTNEALLKVIQRRGNGLITIDRTLFNGLDLSLKRRAARKMIADLRTNIRDIGFEPVERAVDFIGSDSVKGYWRLMDDLNITRIDASEDLLYLNSADLDVLWPLLQTCERISLPADSQIEMNAYWQISRLDSYEVLRNFDKNSNAAYFDLDQISKELTLSTWKKGESFTPFGMTGKKVKVGDFFTNLHIPEIIRDRWPILRSGGEILWIIGLRRSDLARVTQSTRIVTTIHFQQKS